MERLISTVSHFCKMLHDTPLKSFFNTNDSLCGCLLEFYRNCKQLILNSSAWDLTESTWLQVVQDGIFNGVTGIEHFWINISSFYICPIKSLSVGFFKAERNTTPRCDHSDHVCFWSTYSFFNFCVLFYYMRFHSRREAIHRTTWEREGTSLISLY